ncbi:uncharacterized protein KY384_005215 [Bacidia gigantensis]|uniref:uncharacterized protein n=1 Tax=Bacidia gigantensis TaxID=2732470 RepID=UPI001D04A976|nr:uncharacterized protein KY384_005215 [Bacidia gigantensis]KAG8529734.1 hypothetical protein KY384_005215 [Bacidia gigantensis]
MVTNLRRMTQKGEQPKAYLRVPGYDVHETKAFFPRDATGRVNVNGSWTVEDPLRELAESSDVPERCLIPRFPDDPKGRFVDSLDEEIPEERPTDSQAESQDTTKLAHSGKWRSIGSLDQFWEAMSFRQECSSGRLVGFLWAVFIPNRWSHDDTKVETAPETTAPGSPNGEPSASIPTQPLSQVLSESSIPPPNDEPNFDGLAQRSEVTGNYYWPKTSRGEAVLQQQEYDEVFKFLLDLDYGNKEKAKASTSKWMGEIAHRADLLTWGRVISGERPIAPNLPQAATGEQVTNLLSAGLVRKKKRIADDDVLMAVTKKPKTQ